VKLYTQENQKSSKKILIDKNISKVYKNTMDNKKLRKRCKKLLIDKDLDYGNRVSIASDMGINSNSLSMALTGYRDGLGSTRILIALYDYLKGI